MLMSQCQKARQGQIIQTVNRSFEGMAHFKYFGATLTDQNCMHEKIKVRLNLGNACYHFNVKWVHCHHGMARPGVADRGDGLQIWRVAANISNKQSRTVGGPPAWWLDGGLTTLPRKTQYLLQITTHSLVTGWITCHNLST
jgi:hypothetical protein